MQIGWLWFQAFAAALGGFLGWYLGGMDSVLYALIVFVIVDYVTGVLSAIHDKSVSSKIGSRGISKKVMIFLLVGIAHMVDSQVIGHDSVLRTAVIFFYLTNEGISILENAAHLGLPVPTRLKDVLARLHGDKEEEKEKELERETLERLETDAGTDGKEAGDNEAAN